MTHEWSHSNDVWDDGLFDYRPIDDDSEEDWFTDADNHPASAAADGDTIETVLVTATNPSGSVTATGFMDGRVFQVLLSSQVTRMTEAELADEVVTTCALASRQAEAAQHYLLATLMRELGQDPASTRSFLEHTIGLPTPETVISEKARMLADYYSGTE
jgi:hypothetical protein